MAKFKVIKRFTKKWPSGFTKFLIMSDSEHPDRNYIILKRNLLGRAGKDQFFNLHYADWAKLKDFIDIETKNDHQWSTGRRENLMQVSGKKLNTMIEANPDLLATILSYKNLTNLNKASFEALDKLGLRVYEIKADNLSFMLSKLSEAKPDELESFITILNQLRIGQISTIATLIKQKISILKLLEDLIKYKETKEKEIHELLNKNLWLLDKNYDIVKTNQPLKDFLQKEIKIDPDLGKKPDLILKMFSQDQNRNILVELKRPAVKLRSEHLGQIMDYKGIIENHNPRIKLDLYLLGYDFHQNFPRKLEDIKVDLFENLINKKKREFDEYLKILEDSDEETELNFS